MKKISFFIFIAIILVSCGSDSKNNDTETPKSEWVQLFNGENLDNWIVRGDAVWEVKDGIMIGDGGMGHIYTDITAKDFEIEGTFKVSENGNSGLYFRANPPEDNPDGFPRGYEAQIDNHQDAHTGWLWKPGSPTAQAKELITNDDEWFNMKVRMVGNKMNIWVNDKLMTEYEDTDYSEGHFAIQGHNPGMTIEIKKLQYIDLSKL